MTTTSIGDHKRNKIISSHCNEQSTHDVYNRIRWTIEARLFTNCPGTAENWDEKENQLEYWTHWHSRDHSSLDHQPRPALLSRVGTKTWSRQNLTGTIKAKTVNLGRSSYVKGAVTADQITIEGEVDGDIQGKDVYIKSSAKIKGTIRYSNIDIQDGSIINADLTIS